MARRAVSNIVNAMEDGNYFVENETPTGSINGSNTGFTLANNPNPDSSLEVYLNGQKLTVTEDYTISGTTLTLGTAPPTGSLLRVSYRINPV